MFPLFYKQVAPELARTLTVFFWHLVRGSSFPAFRRLADVVPVLNGAASSYVGDYRPISITHILSKVFEKIVTGILSNFLKSYSMFPPSKFSYRRGLGTGDALLTLSNYLLAALDRGIERRLFQLDFSAAFDRVSHCDLLHKLRSTGVGGQFLSLVSEFLSDRRQRVRLDGKGSTSVDVVSGVTQGSVLVSLLFILYTSELLHIIGYHIMGYADGTMIYAVISGPLSRPQVMESMNQDLAAIKSWCMKWHMRLNNKKTKSMVVSRSWPSAPGYGGFTLVVLSLRS